MIERTHPKEKILVSILLLVGLIWLIGGLFGKPELDPAYAEVCDTLEFGTASDIRRVDQAIGVSERKKLTRACGL